LTAVLWGSVALPLAGAALVRLAPRAHATLAGLAAAVAAVPALVLLVAAAGGEEQRSAFAWLPGGPGLDVGFRLDPLSAAMAALVATVGLVVVFYSSGYFARSERAPSALAGLLGFLAAMQGLVLADGYLTMLVFWELVGAMSARLIAWSRDDPAAPGGAVRAFLTTRSADLGFYLAVLALYTAAGTLAFGTVRPEGALGAVVGIGLVVAAMGKSAQVPFQTWLAGAMAGPTPVSALLHSATMVAAGVYLLVRSESLLAGWPLELAGWVGGVTAVLGAAIALGQRDLKRLLAGSTTSQLGFMFLAAAAGGPTVAIFYLVGHAAGKAAMFLATGVFQHARGSTALEALRGAGRENRQAFACFVAGAASVAAVPPLALFWAKDAVIAAAGERPAWLALALLAAAGSAAYLLRPALVLWRAAPRRAPAGPQAGPGRPAMLAGAAALGAASILLGAAGEPLGELLGAPLPETSAAGIGAALAALVAGTAAIWLGLSAPEPVRRAAAAQLHVNDALRAVVERPLLALARLSNVVDGRVVDAAVDGAGRAGLRTATANDRVERDGVDAAVDGLARAIGRGGEGTSRVQSGRLYEYLRDTVVGAGAVGALIAVTALT
jgi:NADH-quinone oxidoreductase subunit L